MAGSPPPRQSPHAAGRHPPRTRSPPRRIARPARRASEAGPPSGALGRSRGEAPPPPRCPARPALAVLRQPGPPTAAEAHGRSSEAGGAQEASQIIPGLRQRSARLALEEMLPQGLALALFQGLFLEEPALKWLMAHSLASTSSCDRLAARPTVRPKAAVADGDGSSPRARSPKN